MAINRFDVYQPQGHVSQYVPLPFQELAAIGQQMQKDYEGALTSLQELPSLLKDSKGLKEVYGYGQKGLANYYVQDHDMISAYNQELKNRLNTLTDDIMSGKLKGNEYKSEINKLKTQVQSDIAPTGKIGQATARYNTYQKNLEELQKAKDVNKAAWLASPIYQNVGEFLSGQADIRTAGVGEFVDRNKELNEALSHIRSVGSSWAGTDGKYIREGSWDKVSPEKIKGAFEGWFQNSATKGDIEAQVMHAIRSGRLPATEESYQQAYANAKNALLQEALGLYEYSKATKNIQGDPNYGYQREDEALANSLKGQPIEATELNLISNDKDYNALLKLGVFTKTADGKYVLNKEKLKESSIADQLPFGSLLSNWYKEKSNLTGKNVAKETANKKLLEVQIQKMAKVVGETDVSEANYEKILNKYSALSKVRMYGEQMADPIAEVETKKVINNLNNYDIMDPSNPDKPLDKDSDEYKKIIGEISANKDGFKLNSFKVTPSGKMSRVGYIIDKETSKPMPVVVRPGALIDDKFHNQIAEISLNAVMFENGIKSNVKSEKDGTLYIDRKIFPGFGTVETFPIKDENNGKTIVGYLVTPQDNPKASKTYYNQGSFMNAMNENYFSTPEGKSDTYTIGTQSQRFKSTQK